MGRTILLVLIISGLLGAYIIFNSLNDLYNSDTTDPTQAGEVGQQAPEFKSNTPWVNTKPLSLEALKGKVVIVDFWTFSCRNCINTFPHLKEWHKNYSDDGLVIVGVHSPEFRFERDIGNLKEAITSHGIEYPVVQDNDFRIWNAYNNQYWPSKYLIDKNGVIRYTHIGEGAYEETEDWIVRLLEEEV